MGAQWRGPHTDPELTSSSVCAPLSTNRLRYAPVDQAPSDGGLISVGTTPPIEVRVRKLAAIQTAATEIPERISMRGGSWGRGWGWPSGDRQSGAVVFFEC